MRIWAGDFDHLCDHSDSDAENTTSLTCVRNSSSYSKQVFCKAWRKTYWYFDIPSFPLADGSKYKMRFVFFFTFDKTYQLIALMTIEFGFHFFCKVERIRRAFYQRIFGSRSLHSSARIHVLLFRSFVWAFLGKFSCWFRPGCNILLVDLLDSNQGNEFFLFPIWLKNY